MYFCLKSCFWSKLWDNIVKHWVLLPPSRELNTGKPKGEGGVGCLWGFSTVLYLQLCFDRVLFL